MNDNSLFSNDHVGGQFYWWIGQVCQSKFWRENLTDKPVADRKDIPGFGYRYKVRIIGIHDKPEGIGRVVAGAGDALTGNKYDFDRRNPPPTDEELPWCGVINSSWGGGEGASLQTPGIRQGSFVFGFFLDGLNQQNPVILGVLGNHFKYRAKDGVFRTFGASTGYDNITDNQIQDSDIPTERNFKSESCDAPNLECKATEKQKISLKKKQHLECVYKKDGAKGGLQVALGNLSDGLGLFQKAITEYPSALAKGEEKLNKLLDKHLGDVTKNMNSIMSLVESFSTASALEVAAVLISKADPSLKLKLTKAQEKQLKVLACMFGAISRGLGGKIKKAVKNKLFDNQQPLPEGYYLPSNPCFTEAIIADVMAQSIDEITDTMDSSNKNILEQASGLLGGLSNLSASALLPTGLLSGAISGGLGSIGGGLNLGGAMSFITGLTTFFACIKEASCPESDTISNDGGEGDSNKEANLDNAMSKVEQEKKNQEIQAYADDNGISFDRAKNFLEGGVEETVLDGTITPPSAEETVFNSNLDYGNLTEVDYSKFVDDSNNYFKESETKYNVP